MTIPVEWLGPVILGLLISYLLAWGFGAKWATRFCVEMVRRSCEEIPLSFKERGRIIGHIIGRPAEWVAREEAQRTK